MIASGAQAKAPCHHLITAPRWRSITLGAPVLVFSAFQAPLLFNTFLGALLKLAGRFSAWCPRPPFGPVSVEVRSAQRVFPNRSRSTGPVVPGSFPLFLASPPNASADVCILDSFVRDHQPSARQKPILPGYPVRPLLTTHPDHEEIAASEQKTYAASPEDAAQVMLIQQHRTASTMAPHVH